jgi:peptidyl-prolyl cis-trans isomerase D
LRANDYFFGSLGQGNSAREIIRWAFNNETSKDKVSKEYFTFADENGGYFDSKYVVTALKTINPKGEATVEGVRTQIEALVKNKKKADAIKAKLGTADIAAAASQYGVAVDTARGASMMQPSLNNGGMEPRVVGTAFSLANGAVSKPIEGNAGVYIVKAIMDKPAAQLPPDLTLFRKQVASGAANSVKTSLMRAWKKASDIEDNRSRFF